MTGLPPPHLRARIGPAGLDRPRGCPDVSLVSAGALGRRSFLKAVTTGLSLFGSSAYADALVFSPQDDDIPAELPASLAERPALRVGQIPPDFWELPRELWLKRQGTQDEVRVVYWKDGALVSEGYWQACAMLRDVRANVMTTMDPLVLDILRGVSGYYNAWNFRKPLVLTSGFRTEKTNRAISKEGAAHNSMHLYGKATDLFIPGVPARDVGALGLHLRQGGVGFYPSRGFTHLDTGRLRTWVG